VLDGSCPELRNEPVMAENPDLLCFCILLRKIKKTVMPNMKNDAKSPMGQLMQWKTCSGFCMLRIPVINGLLKILCAIPENQPDR
jgi:hypothetical protein